jgi:biofilm PGA synthesis N-glycosyltransferase PgaC
MAFIIIISIYSVMMLVLVVGFNRLKAPKRPASVIHSITVIVPIRNEANDIRVLLHSLASVQYPTDKWEVIIVDDHSTDGFQDARIIQSKSVGKKAAITTGIEAAKGDIIVTTDADCRVKPLWLEKINIAFQDPKIQMMIGGVRIEEDGSFFSQLQALEFVSVAVTGAATLGLGFPTMCNGANLSYRKTFFIEAGGYSGNEKISSGDDEALMNKLSRISKGSIGYLYSTDSLVTTSPSHHVRTFLDQRLRWAGKWKSNTSSGTKIFAVFIWIFHLSFVLSVFIIPLKIFLIVAAAKVCVEALLLIPAAKFFQVKWRWISFLVLQFIYSFYVISVGFMSQILSSEWKGRAVGTKV